MTSSCISNLRPGDKIRFWTLNGWAVIPGVKFSKLVTRDFLYENCSRPTYVAWTDGHYIGSIPIEWIVGILKKSNSCP